MVTLARPFLLVFALYVLPLNLNVILLFLIATFPFLRVAFKINFLADFLTLTVLVVFKKDLFDF